MLVGSPVFQSFNPYVLSVQILIHIGISAAIQVASTLTSCSPIIRQFSIISRCQLAIKPNKFIFAIIGLFTSIPLNFRPEISISWTLSSITIHMCFSLSNAGLFLSGDIIPISPFRQLFCLICKHPQDIYYQTCGCLKIVSDRIYRIYVDSVIQTAYCGNELNYIGNR